MAKENKQCQNCKEEFTIEPEDFAFYEKIKVPAPTWCPDCRLKRRLLWRNERSLYKRKCAATGESTFSTYAPDSPFIVYTAQYWAGDKWDAIVYGQDYDFSRPFWKQWRELQLKVPVRALFRSNEAQIINSPYANLISNLENCYFIFNSDYNQDCYYGQEFQYCKDCFDCKMVDSCELCYEAINCRKCYQTFFSIDCESCVNVWFSKNCIGCTTCFGCVGLRKKSYCFFNEQYTKEEYEKLLQEIDTSSYETIQELTKKFNDFEIKFPVKEIHGFQNKDVSGDYIYNSRNVKNSYFVTEGWNVKWGWMLLVPTTKDSYDYSEYGDNAELMYECITAGLNSNTLRFCVACVQNCLDLSYCQHCSKSSNCFGCIGLKSKQYCIFNKQYTKEEYEVLVPKIIEHMSNMLYTDKKGRVYKYGEFFPSDFSPYGYNETSANDYFPLSKNQIINDGFSWRDIPQTENAVTIKASDLPDRVDDVENIAKEVISSFETGKAFRVLENEYQFLKRMRLPIPREHPFERIMHRFKKLNGMKLYHRKCAKTGKDILTTYPPDDPHIVYSEEAYE